MAASDLVFRHESFTTIIDRLCELIESDAFDMGGYPETAIEVVAANYDEAIRYNGSDRTLTDNEFLDMLIIHLYRALCQKTYRFYLERDLGMLK